jgi:hypothetical protein
MQEALIDSSNLTGLGMLFLALIAVLTFSLPRKQAVLPLLATACYMPLGQQMVIAGLHFTILRLLIFVGVARVLCRGEARGLSLNRIDKLFLWWAVLGVILGYVSKPGSQILVNRLGTFYNAVGIYFLVCCWVRDSKTFVASVKFLALLAIPLAVLMIVEKTTARNVFSVFGGVPEITAQREGHLRCQAAFRHPILAGTFGAISLPLFIGLWFQGRRARTLALLGGISACTIAIAASSGGPLLVMLLGGVGFGLWRLRHRMRLVRRGIVGLILALAIVMQAPVWYLIAKAGNVVGGGGWYRSMLIDTTAAHISEWWLCGTTYTAHWAPAQFILEDDPDNIDLPNQYAAEAVRGGALKLTLFIAIIVQCFKVLGRRIQAEALGSEAAGVLWWAIGVCLFTHCVSFLSIVYFDQMVVFWYWLLAAISRVACDEVGDPARLAGEVGLESTSSESPLAAQDLFFQ